MLKDSTDENENLPPPVDNRSVQIDKMNPNNKTNDEQHVSSNGLNQEVDVSCSSSSCIVPDEEKDKEDITTLSENDHDRNVAVVKANGDRTRIEKRDGPQHSQSKDITEVNVPWATVITNGSHRSIISRCSTSEDKLNTDSSTGMSQLQDVTAGSGSDGNGNDVVIETKNFEQQQQRHEENVEEPFQILNLHKQIQGLLSERDSSQKEQKQQKLFLTELETKLKTQISHHAEVEHQLHSIQEKYESSLSNNSNLEDKLEKTKASVLQITSSKALLEQEVSNLRASRDERERKVMVLQNRLNDAKKKEAQSAASAGRLLNDNSNLQDTLDKTKLELSNTSSAKGKLENSLEKLKKKVVERIKLSESALVEERTLNEQRKKKMKTFVETKAEELRSAGLRNDKITAELKETSSALSTVRNKFSATSTELIRVQTRNRDLVREVNKMKKNSEQLHKAGDTLEMELHKSAQETEEHRSKRLAARDELMAMVEKLDAEQSVSERLKDSVKFTFTPKAISQQQLLTESLYDFEGTLLKLARRLGKPLPSSPLFTGDCGDDTVTDGSGGGIAGVQAEDINTTKTTVGGAGSKKNGKRNTRSEWDTTRLLSNLESETQMVSKGIMALGNSVERLHLLLDDSGDRSCTSVINELFGNISDSGSGGGGVREVVGSQVSGGGHPSLEEGHGLVQSSPIR